jgi:hypothetical protein
MELPAWVEKVFTLSLELSQWRQLGLAFLLGSFAVATLSDLRRLSAQQEFVEIWVLFLLGMLAYDLRDLYVGTDADRMLLAKWGLILVLSVLSLHRVGVLFRLAFGDVAALAAAASLLTPALIVILFLAAKCIAAVLGPILSRGRAYYPFMPVVTLATLLVLALGLATGRGTAFPPL